MTTHQETATDETLIEDMHSGDPDAANILIERYKNTVRRKARGYFLVGGDTEDLLQEGMIGLFKAMQSYSPERGASFHTFAELCIERQIMSAIQTATRKKQGPLNSYVSFAEQVFGDNDMRELGDIFSTETHENPEERLISQENIKQIDEEIQDSLSDFEKEVLKMHLEGQGYQQIAKSLDKSPKSIDNALQRIRRKLKQRLMLMEEGDVE